MNKIIEYNGKQFKLESFQWHSKNYLKQFSDSLSMSKLEEQLKGLKGSRLQYVSGGYLYYNKESIDKLKYPSLHQIRKEFEEAINGKDEMDSYYKVNHSLFVKCYARERDNEYKDGLRISIKKAMERDSVSISSLASVSGVKKANLSNFLVKGINSSISMKKLLVIFDILEG